MTSRVVHFEVPIDADRQDIDVAMTKVEHAGGTLVTGKLPIPTMGWSARFRDTEGNLIGLFQTDSTVPVPDGGVGG
jgi:hypothetical protein